MWVRLIAGTMKIDDRGPRTLEPGRFFVHLKNLLQKPLAD
jgi:hypothetical protein